MLKSTAKKSIDDVLRLQCPRPDYLKLRQELRPWTCIRKKRGKGFIELTYQVPAGLSHNDIEKQVDAIQAALGRLVKMENRLSTVSLTVAMKDFPDVVPLTMSMVETYVRNDTLLLGFDIMGTPRQHKLKTPHLTIGGMSGYGKTDLLRFIVWQLLILFKDQINITIIDGKGFSFLPFRNIPQITVIRDFHQACAEIKHIYGEQQKRSDIVWNTGDRSKVKSFPWEFLIIDEAAMFAPSMIRNNEDDKEMASEADSYLAKISGVGREARVALIYCTQRPDATIINPLVKANMDISVTFRTKTVSNSIVIIDRPGAEELPQGTPGRAIVSATADTIIQVPYLGDDDAWVTVLTPYKTKGETIEHERIEEKPIVTSVVRLSDLFDSPNSSVVHESRFTGETGIGNIEEVRAGEIDSRTLAGISTESVEIDQEGEGFGEGFASSENDEQPGTHISYRRNVFRIMESIKRIPLLSHRIAGTVRKSYLLPGRIFHLSQQRFPIRNATIRAFLKKMGGKME